ncbi:MAG: hypothetical protein ACE5IK_02410 [Acidobacteriota bacterium]
MHRVVSAALAILALTLSTTATAGWLKPKHLVVRGQVTDAPGHGVAGIPVRVIATRRVVKFLSIESHPAEKELVAAITGPSGFYELEVPKVRDYDFYFLRFYDGAHFDGVRYARPDDVEITAWIDKRRPVIQDVTLAPAAGWDAVQRLVKLYGAESPRGRIVRELGVPERTDHAPSADGVDRETWWYDRAGVAYVIENGQVVDRQRFRPRQETRPLARR